MSQMTLSPMCGPMTITETLPPAPDVRALQRQVDARLEAIETEALPALAIRSGFLVRTWSAEDGDGLPVFTMSGEAVLTHPAGVDRLACVLAEQEGLTHEASALRELAGVLELYDAGGSSTLRAVGQSAPGGAGATAREHPTERDAVSSEPAYTRWLLDYLLAVKREMWAARKHRDTLRLEDLDAEFAELQVRVRRHVEGKAGRAGEGSVAPALSLTA